MKNKILLICFKAILLLIYAPTKSQSQFSVELKFTASDTTGKPAVMLPLIVGIDNRATDSVDYDLGEKDFPQHPPSGFHAGLLVTDGISTGVSYKDYRRIPPQKKFMKEYELDVTPPEFRANDPFYISWDYPLDGYIDSAHFSDRLDGSIVFFRFDDKKSCQPITTPLKKFYIRVWYNVESSNVVQNENLYTDKIEYYKTSETISVFTETKSHLTLYSSLASTLWAGEVTDSEYEINVQNIASGIYFLTIQKPDGRTTNHKVMIVR